jgi:putative DNA primase/helicase
LRSGKIREHARDDLISRVAPVNYDPEAKCPTFEAHIKLVTQGNKDLAGYLQRLLGYCLTGEVGESVFPIFLGSGQNGKSTLLRAIRNTVGVDYVATAPPGFLMIRGQENHETELAPLAGSRLVIASETGIGRRLNVEQMKQLTGEDRLRGRYLYHDSFEFPITFKVIYMTNHKPQIRNTEVATWRRIKLIPFDAVITPEQKDGMIDEKLRYEGSGILNWLIRGCREWNYGGLGEPAEVVDATAMYKEDSDPVGTFIKEKLAFGSGRAFRVSLSRMAATYAQWAQETGGPELGIGQLGKILREREEWKVNQVALYITSGQKFWKNVGMVADQDVQVFLNEKKIGYRNGHGSA